MLWSHRLKSESICGGACCALAFFLSRARATHTLQVSVIKWLMFIIRGPSIGWN
jgi:hypothetical protein